MKKIVMLMIVAVCLLFTSGQARANGILAVSRTKIIVSNGVPFSSSVAVINSRPLVQKTRIVQKRGLLGRRNVTKIKQSIR